MAESRLRQAKEKYQELQDLTILLDEAYSNQYTYPENQNLKDIALELQKEVYMLDGEFKDKYHDIIIAGIPLGRTIVPLICDNRDTRHC